MTDALEILSSLHSENEPYVPTFSSEKWSYIPDFNSNSYPTQIQWSTKDIKNKKVVWRDAYVTIPLNVYSDLTANPLTPYTNATKVALKNSVLSLVYGLVLNNIGGGNVVNENQIQFINNLRLILDTDTDFIESKSAELMFGVDNVVWSPGAPSGQPIATAGVAVTNNSGFLKRITFLQMLGFQGAGTVANSFQFLAYIPLRFLHPIFDVADFVMYGSNFELFLQLSFLSNNQYPPFLAEIGTILPQVSINTAQTPCRLYYKAVEFDVAEDAKYTQKLTHGYKIRRDYLSCDVYASLPNLQNTTTSMNNLVITSSVTNPVALYALLYPTNSFKGPTRTIDTTAVTLAVTATQKPLAPVGTLSNTSVYLNGTNCFPDSQFITPLDYWQLLKERLVGYQSDVEASGLTYYDFLHAQRIHYFDLSKTARLYENQNVQVTITSNRGVQPDGTADAVACDYLLD